MTHTEITTGSLHQLLSNMDDAEFIEARAALGRKISLYYIRTLIDQERLNEVVVEPLVRDPDRAAIQCLAASKVITISRLEEAHKQLLSGAVVLNDTATDIWLAVPLENPLSRSVESSETETIIYGAKDSFSEQIEQNITMIRRRLPLAELKTEKFTVGTLSKTTLMLMYMDGLTNPEFIETARSKISNIDFDQFLDSSQVAAFMEDHHHTIFPQFLETDRPDACANALGIGKLVILVNNTPYALIAPITFFHLFQSPEDYFLRWPVASFFRCIRYFGFFLSVVLMPFYVALATHHYQMLPLQILYVLLESRSKLPFSPFWEAFIMMITLEIIKEASLRMPTKTSQTLGIIGGIVMGQAAVQAGFASKVLIVFMGISAISSFLVPNYLMTRSSTLIQFVFLVLSAFLGIPGIIMGIIVFLIHLNGLSSLKQPFFAPVSPFYGKEWFDLFIRGPLTWMKTRPESLRPLQIWRYSKRR
ncbi:spore germination protein [Paenibacillus sp. FSL H7-0331]|uniref:spore germination protein n=1 Tax=Paenibacillus sp. FSL H7-0331 TaxID=1920421 RepID=UPI00096CD21F|nr:spore germination protein [Paenibacillus sp. FSL H7-0331]OMF16362.1 spore germination protein [Paenibacillus sp. FSL H7-0331]